VKITLKL